MSNARAYAVSSNSESTGFELPTQQMIREVILGKRGNYTKKEIGAMIDAQLLSFEPIVPLTKSEDELLKRTYSEYLFLVLNNGMVRKFLEAECYLIKGDNSATYSHVYEARLLDERSSYSHIKKLIKESGLKPMTKDEKLALLSDISSLRVRISIDYYTTSFAQMGYRSIEEYSLFCTSDRFTEKVRILQKELGKQELNILDLGGGIGTALRKAKELHPELNTFNVTRGEEHVYYPSDCDIFCFAERMPNSLRGKIDYIFSNMSTRYLVFCDLVVKGCFEALAIGGSMEVFFSCERTDNPDMKDVKRRMDEAYRYLKELESSKVIHLEILSKYTTNFGGSFEANKDSLYPASGVRLKRLK